jgi:cytochrome c-type biogenesis protein CcmE
VSRRRVAILAAVVLLSLGWVVSRGLASNLVYYLTPSDILAKGTSGSGDRVRLGGYVLPGTVRSSGSLVQFVVSDGQHQLAVIASQGVPSLFKEGRGVVVEGVYGADGIFRADTVLVKHNNEYQPPAPGATPPHSAVVSGG